MVQQRSEQAGISFTSFVSTLEAVILCLVARSFPAVGEANVKKQLDD